MRSTSLCCLIQLFTFTRIVVICMSIKLCADLHTYVSCIQQVSPCSPSSSPFLITLIPVHQRYCIGLQPHWKSAPSENARHAIVPAHRQPELLAHCMHMINLSILFMPGVASNLDECQPIEQTIATCQADRCQTSSTTCTACSAGPAL